MLMVSTQKALTSLALHLQLHRTSLALVLQKVIEDVDKVNHEKTLNSDRQKAYRNRHSDSNALHNDNVTQQSREEESREESKTSAELILIKDRKANQIDLKDIKLFDFNEASKHKIFNQIIKIFSVRGWGDNPDFIKSVFAKVAASMNGVKPQSPYPYFQSSLSKYLNEHSEEITKEAKKWNTAAT